MLGRRVCPAATPLGATPFGWWFVGRFAVGLGFFVPHSCLQYMRHAVVEKSVVRRLMFPPFTTTPLSQGFFINSERICPAFLAGFYWGGWNVSLWFVVPLPVPRLAPASRSGRLMSATFFFFPARLCYPDVWLLEF